MMSREEALAKALAPSIKKYVEAMLATLPKPEKGDPGVEGKEGPPGKDAVVDYEIIIGESIKRIRATEQSRLSQDEMKALFEFEGKKFFAESIKQPSPTINLNPEIHISPVINVPQSEIKQDPPVVNVQIPEKSIVVENKIEARTLPKKTIKVVERDGKGQISRIEETENPL